MDRPKRGPIIEGSTPGTERHDSNDYYADGSSLRFNLDEIIDGLASDLVALRQGKLSLERARASAELAKQLFNGVRIAINLQQLIAERAKQIEGPKNG